VENQDMLFKLKSLFRSPQKAIIIVSGLPRSGTSMMMKILESGGLEIMTDQVRQADDDNPKGYYEFERVKRLPEKDFGWLPGAAGKGVKIISFLLQYLPGQYQYKIIFMRRAISEILASQKKMLSNRGEIENTNDTRMEETYQEHLKRTRVWLANQPNIKTLQVDYNLLIKSPPEQIKTLYDFLELPLDINKMVVVPDAALYRQRKFIAKT
jgi:hypothetical protein